VTAPLIPVAAVVVAARVAADNIFPGPTARLTLLLIAAVTSACFGALQFRHQPASEHQGSDLYFSAPRARVEK
jgi:hypothetical protein